MTYRVRVGERYVTVSGALSGLAEARVFTDMAGAERVALAAAKEEWAQRYRAARPVWVEHIRKAVVHERRHCEGRSRGPGRGPGA